MRGQNPLPYLFTLILLVVGVGVFCGITYRPISEAKAYKINVQAQMARERHSARMADREATAEIRHRNYNLLTTGGVVIGLITAAVLAFSLAIDVLGRAAIATYARLIRSQRELIYLDEGRQYPAVIEYGPRGELVAVTDPNTGMSRRLGQEGRPYRELGQGANEVRLKGARPKAELLIGESR